MKIALLGPSDLRKIRRLAEVSETALQLRIRGVAKILADKKHTLMIVPDIGICLEVAKLYKKSGGKDVVGIVPRGDNEYGIEHLRGNLGIIDREIAVNSWHEVAPTLIYGSDMVVCMGLSAGVLIELGYIKYNLKWKKNKVKKLLVFRDMIADYGLPHELEEDLKPILRYIDSVKQLANEV